MTTLSTPLRTLASQRGRLTVHFKVSTSAQPVRPRALALPGAPTVGPYVDRNDTARVRGKQRPWRSGPEARVSLRDQLPPAFCQSSLLRRSSALRRAEASAPARRGYPPGTVSIYVEALPGGQRAVSVPILHPRVPKECLRSPAPTRAGLPGLFRGHEGSASVAPRWRAGWWCLSRALSASIVDSQSPERLHPLCHREPSRVKRQGEPLRFSRRYVWLLCPS